MLSVITSPNPVLNKVCEPCDLADKQLKRLSKQMVRLMYKFSGCGLAAPQVGISKRLVVIDCDQDETKKKNPIVLINPKIVETSGELKEDKEGCLSIPGISIPITRPEYARCRYFDFDGQEWEIEGDGLLGRCLQHECEHLDGKTMFEVCTPAARLQALEDYEIALANGARIGDTGNAQE